MNSPEQLEERVLVVAPTGKDAELTRAVLQRAGLRPFCCTAAQLSEALDAGAGVLLLAEEAVDDTKTRLCEWVAQQPAWSDLPVLVLAHARGDAASLAQTLHGLGNVDVLERPLRVAALLNAVQTALRARRRQYGTRKLFDERDRAESELRAIDRRKDEFLAMLAHELRNPLAPILNAAELLGMVSDDPRRTREMSELIVRQVRHISEIVDDLLDVSRVTRGLVTLNREIVDLRTLVIAAVEQCLPLIDGRQHRLDLQLPDVPIWVDGDRARLIQIFSNLVNNAAKYSQPGATIRIAFDQRDEQVEVSIEDNGDGIDAELLPRIFGLFAQGQRGADRSQGGLGIGLSLVKTLVQLHDGSVEAISEGSGRGSVFVVRLPAAMAPPEQAGPPAAAGIAAVRSGRVLVLDDNVDAANALAAVLEHEGHVVATVYDARRALVRARASVFDAMILDIGLPGMDGYRLAREIRALPGTHDTTLIAVSGYGQPEDRRRATEAGFDHHLVKPVDHTVLQALLQRPVSEPAATEGR